MRRNFESKVVVVTGASRGLGAAVALAFAGRGAKIALLARSAEQLSQVAARAKALGAEAMTWPTDVSDWDAAQEAIRGILNHWDRIDVLVNAAGVKHEGPIERTSVNEATTALGVNYLGALACCKVVIPAMRRQGGGHGGHIINVSSVLGKRATPERGVYSASKAALNAMTDALRLELWGTGIHVTLVCPGRLTESSIGRGRWLAMTPEQAAARIVQCVDRLPREVVLTPAGRALAVLNALAPGLVDRVLLYWRHRDREVRADTEVASRHNMSTERELP